jgi:TRAP-type C4-dicarboxylate transport system permease small subunit
VAGALQDRLNDEAAGAPIARRLARSARRRTEQRITLSHAALPVSAMPTFRDALDALTKLTMVVAAFCAFGLAFLILTDVLARNTGHTFVGVPEYVRNTLIVIIFLQLPFAVRLRSMLVVDIFVGVLPDTARVPLAVFGYMLGFAFFGALAYGAFEPAVNAWVKGEVEGEGVVEVAAWPAKFAIVYGCGLAALLYALRIHDTLRSGKVLPPASEIPVAD